MEQNLLMSALYLIASNHQKTKTLSDFLNSLPDDAKWHSGILMILSVFILLSVIFIIWYKFLKSRYQLKIRNRQMDIALKAGHLEVYVYDVAKNTFTVLHSTGSQRNYISYEDAIATIHPDDQQQYADQIFQLINGLKKHVQAVIRVKPLGQEHYCHIEVELEAMTNRHGDVSKILGTRRDVTNTIKASEEKDAFLTKLNYTLKTSGIRIWEYNTDTQMFSFMSSPDVEVERTTFDNFMKRVDISEYERNKALFEKMRMGELEAFSVQCKLMTSIYGEGIHYYEYSGVPMRDNMGKVTSYFGITRDITTLINIQQRLKEEKQKAESADKLKSTFLANMSHDIRTPLNAIVGFSHLLTETENKKDKESFEQIIKQNSENLLRLVNDILELSRIESGIIDIRNAEFDMSADFDRLMMSLQHKDTNTDVQFIVTNPYSKCIIKSDSNRIDELLTNFITNAFKNTHEGNVTAGYNYVDGGIRIWVKDTGIGIERNRLDSIFRRFIKIDEFKSGSGLGLSICRGIIDAMEGKIGVDSELGKGSLFWAWIPCPSIEMVKK